MWRQLCSCLSSQAPLRHQYKGRESRFTRNASCSRRHRLRRTVETLEQLRRDQMRSSSIMTKSCHASALTATHVRQFKTLLVTVVEAIVEVFILCLAGYILARAGITDKATQRKMNVINVSLFTPALLFSKVAFSLSPSKLKEMWIIPVGFVVISSVSALIAWTLGGILRLTKSQRNFAMCAAMFQNSNSLIIALIQSLIVEVPGLKWDEEDNKDAMLGRALTYLVLYSTLGMMLRWSWGVKLLSVADDEPPAAPAIIADVQPERVLSPEALAPHPGAIETDPFFSTGDQVARDESIDEANTAAAKTLPFSTSPTVSDGLTSAHSMQPTGRRSSSAERARTSSATALLSRRFSNLSATGRKPPTRTESGREFWGLPETKQPTSLSDQDEESEEEDEEWGELPNLRRRSPSGPPSSRFRSFLGRFKTRAGKILKSVNSFMTVPMYSALLSIFIAMVPPLQAFLGEVKPLRGAIKSAGQCSIPLTLVVLGAFFYAEPTPASNSNSNVNTEPQARGAKAFIERKLRNLQAKKPATAYPGENKTVFVAVISRMILTPLVLLPVVALLAKYDPFEAARDPVFVLAATLLIVSPPALTLAQITQAGAGDKFERLISKTISWSYAVLTPPTTVLYVVLGLLFGRL